MRLGLNIDHIATLREARKTFEPDLLKAALLAEQLDVDQITVHLRGDRRHIQDSDLKILKSNLRIPLNVEMSTSKEMREIAANLKPQKITLVPEKRNEVTTEGGLDVIVSKASIMAFMKHLNQFSPSTAIAIFVDPSPHQIAACNDLNVSEIEINTGIYARATDLYEIQSEIERIRETARIATELGMEVAAGHGLREANLSPILEIDDIHELNIGHHIIADALFIGLPQKIKQVLKLIRK